MRLVVGRRYRPDLDAGGIAGQQEQAHLTVIGGRGHHHGVSELGGRHQFFGPV